VRLDSYLVQESYFESRNRAKEAIKDLRVKVDGEVIKKPSFNVEDSAKVEVESSKFYISRAARKLEEYLKEFEINFNGAKVLDIGSSTGGFTQIALEKGAKRVDCVDVGSNQLHHLLRENNKVNIYEETDIRDFNGFDYDIVISDVSFISLLKIIDKIDNIVNKDATILLLFKPQFEVGLGVKRDSKGVVKDLKAIKRAREIFLLSCRNLGWELLDSRDSRVAGKEGNIEEFFAFKK